MKTLPICMALCLTALTAAPAQLATNTMLKIVAREISPEIVPGSFNAQPKTYYRMGDRYGRIEEAPNPEHKSHVLLVVNEPKVWLINLHDNTGQLLIDPGPTFVFRASILPPATSGQESPLRDFQFGTEYDFLKSHKATPGQTANENTNFNTLTLTLEGYKIKLLTDAKTGKPFRVQVKRAKNIYCEYEYMEYEKGLPPRMELFEPPTNVKIAGSGPK